MEDLGLRSNPDALAGAPPPAAGLHRVNGTTIYAEVRGSGNAVVLIPGGAEDAESWRGVADRLALAGYAVVTYDRRGTLRSGREDWPGKGSPQHADDAAALIAMLGLPHATVFGGSAAGVIALQVAIRHPEVVEQALVFEPGFLAAFPSGREMQRRANAAIASHLRVHPEDWQGAYHAFAGSIAASPESGGGQVTPGAAELWCLERELLNSEPLMRDDIPIVTMEPIDTAAISQLPTPIRFAYGSISVPIFQEISTHLAGLRGETSDVVTGAGHALYLQPSLAVEYLRSHLPAPAR